MDNTNNVNIEQHIADLRLQALDEKVDIIKLSKNICFWELVSDFHFYQS